MNQNPLPRPRNKCGAGVRGGVGLEICVPTTSFLRGVWRPIKAGGLAFQLLAFSYQPSANAES
jgi:hypothetical protein